MCDEAQNIKYLFEPRSIAVIGASKEKSKIAGAYEKRVIGQKC